MTGHLDPYIRFQKPDDVLSAPQFALGAHLLQDTIQFRRIVLAFLGEPAAGWQHGAASGWLLRVGESEGEVLKLLPGRKPRPIRPVVIRREPLPGFQLDIWHHPVQLEAIMFRVLHPKPAKVILGNTWGDHLLKAVHETGLHLLGQNRGLFRCEAQDTGGIALRIGHAVDQQLRHLRVPPQ